MAAVPSIYLLHSSFSCSPSTLPTDRFWLPIPPVLPAFDFASTRPIACWLSGCGWILKLAGCDCLDYDAVRIR